MRWNIGWQGAVLAIFLFGVGLFLGFYYHPHEEVHSTADERLRPAVTATAESAAGGTIYVPVYSSLFLGLPNPSAKVDLAATVSVRNMSAAQPITLDSVRYYDSVGKHIRDYLDKPSTLPAMGAVELLVPRADTAGGPGANVLIRWHAAAVVDEPLAEAVMLGQSGNAGISFNSRGRPLTEAPER